MERWKEILNFPMYEVSDLGRIRSKYSGRGIRNSDNTINGWTQTVKPGYQRICVSLRKNGKPTIRKVHQLVLETFIGPCPEKMETLHKNGDPLDNRLCNLRWGTHSENIRDSIKHGTKNQPPINSGEDHHNAVLSDKDAEMIRNHTFHRGDQKAFAERFGVSTMCIHRIKNRLVRYKKY